MYNIFFFFSVGTFGGLPPPPPQYQKAGYATEREGEERAGSVSRWDDSSRKLIEFTDKIKIQAKEREKPIISFRLYFFLPLQ